MNGPLNSGLSEAAQADDTLDTVADRLVQARREARLSQDALADRADLSRAQVQSYETGKRHPTTAQLYRIARAVDRPACWFTGGVPVLRADPERDHMIAELHEVRRFHRREAERAHGPIVMHPALHTHAAQAVEWALRKLEGLDDA